MRELTVKEVSAVGGGDRGDAAVAGAIAGGGVGWAAVRGASWGARVGWPAELLVQRAARLSEW